MTASGAAGPAGEVLYLYGFVPSGTPAPDGLTGVGDRPVEVLELGEVAAAVSRESADAFASETLEGRLEDLQWVGERGLRHERVVTRFVDERWILPARLLTLYSSEEALAEEAGRHGVRIRRELDRLEGRREWDLKVSVEPAGLEEHLAGFSEELEGLDVRIAEASPGTRYLLERRRADLVRRERSRVADRLAREVYEAAAELAEDARVLEAPPEARELPVVLNAALLVRAEREEPLRREVGQRRERLAPLGVRVGFSGPWAPYRFLEAWEGGRRDA